MREDFLGKIYEIATLFLLKQQSLFENNCCMVGAPQPLGSRTRSLFGYTLIENQSKFESCLYVL